MMNPKSSTCLVIQLYFEQFPKHHRHPHLKPRHQLLPRFARARAAEAFEKGLTKEGSFGKVRGCSTERWLTKWWLGLIVVVTLEKWW